MPREKKTRNALGSVLPVEVVIGGKTVTRYNARRRYTKPDGSRGEKTKRCRSIREAQIQLHNFDAEIQRELSGEATGKPGIHTFFELCDHFDSEYIKDPVFVGDRQLRGYRQNLSALRTYVADYRDFFGDRDVARITYEDCLKYAERIATTPVKAGKGHKTAPTRLPKPSTVNRKLAYLRRMFNVAIQLDWIQRNPFNLGRRLIDADAEQPRERVLSFDEEERLLAHCEGPREHLKAAVIMAIESGMRKREMFSTIRSQVNFDKMVLELNPRQTKALRRRLIPISDRLAGELRILFATRQLVADDLIFGGAKDFDRAFATACRLAEISDLHFHDLRHTAMTWMDEAGLTDAGRRNIGGHGSVRVGQRYVNPSQDVLDSSRVKMNEFRDKLEERRKRAAAA